MKLECAVDARSDRDFDGRVVLVTGGTRGIGLAVVKAFLLAGARVAFCGRDVTQFGADCEGLGDARRWHALSADMSRYQATAQLVDQTVRHFGRLDILVNNAGIPGPPDAWAIDEAQWDEVQAVNLRAAYFCAREAATVMPRCGGAAIVNITSVAGQIGGMATGPAYAASKAGMVGLTRSLARLLAPRKIRVNGLAPADIETDMVSAWQPLLRDRLIAMTPMGRFGQASEVAHAALYLASSKASYITGHTLNINGGLYMG